MHFGERDLEMRELNGNMTVGGLEADGGANRDSGRA